VINSESQRLLLDGPKVRRNFVNWSLFHVEPAYHSLWRRYDRAVRQRNAALKAHDERLARSWEPEIFQVGSSIDDMRQRVVTMLRAGMEDMLATWFPDEDISLTYRCGWPQDKSLEEALISGRTRELELGYSLYGPHRADLAFRSGSVEAQHRLSRGQQKLLIFVLLVSQARLYTRYGTIRPIFLVDDLPAELDLERRKSVLTLLQGSGAQIFITATHREAIPLVPEAARWFHVEHGNYREVV
jgi:DNA replication and repair protein RecF